MTADAAALLVSIGCVAAFAIAFLLLRILPAANAAIGVTTEGVAALTSKTLSEREKEAAVQKAGVRLIAHAFGLFLRFAGCAAAAAVPAYLADRSGFVPASATIARLSDPVFLIVTTVVALVLVWLVAKVRGRGKAGGANSQAEQIVHMVAFMPSIQKALFAFDNAMHRLFGRKPGTVQHVFITSLARGGTTACLNAIYSQDGIATNTYRDMPFITAPVVWNGVSGVMARKTERHERAHGDGMEIDLDSPEAFDEVYWKLWWPGKYTDAGIVLWGAGDGTVKQAHNLGKAYEKIVAVRGGHARVYVSKNNANIARLPLLKDMFPDSVILVPLRRPAPHAASLLRQHRNFVRQQTEDRFVERYMRDIGHYEFGLAHKPIRFPGFDPERYEPDSPDYWLHYWICAFEEVQRNAGTVDLVLQDELRVSPDAVMKAVLQRHDIPHDPAADFSAFFRQAEDITDETVFDPALLAQANRLYDALRSRQGEG